MDPIVRTERHAHAQRLLARLKQAGHLPAAPGAALRVVELCRHESVNVADLCDAIAVDPALSGQVLKLANSAAFNAGTPLTSVRQAVLMLGTRAVMVVAMNMCAGSIPEQQGRFDLQHFWTQSVSTAVTARHLSSCYAEHIDREEAFTVGLLAAVGQLAIAQAMGDHYITAVSSAIDQSSLLEKERDAYGVDHIEFAAHLLAHWRLPLRLIQAVRWQHQPTSAPADLVPLTDVLHVSLRVTPFFLEPHAMPKREQVESRKLLTQRLKLTEPSLKTLASAIVTDFQRVSRVLHLAATTSAANRAAS